MNKKQTHLLEILDICISDRNENEFALFDAGGTLHLFDCSDERAREVVRLDNIATTIRREDEAERPMPIALYFHHPFVCVTERFGVNAAVVNLETKEVRMLQREDYHADVSSYSIAFLERKGRTILIHQTQWNRLDFTDLESGELLTPREVYCRVVDESSEPRQYDEKNYLDYFHSLLHVSPGGKYFLSNGWVWQPSDIVRCFRVDDFLQTYECDGSAVEYFGGYNWDRPCTFVDDDTFVIATDNYDYEDEGTFEYKQLRFFRPGDAADGYIPSCRQLDTDLFDFNEYGEISGELHFDAKYGMLVALTNRGAYILDCDGRVAAHSLDMGNPQRNVHTDFGSSYATDLAWRYSPVHHLFYRIDRGGELEVVTYDEFVLGHAG